MNGAAARGRGAAPGTPAVHRHRDVEHLQRCLHLQARLPFRFLRQQTGMTLVSEPDTRIIKRNFFPYER